MREENGVFARVLVVLLIATFTATVSLNKGDFNNTDSETLLNELGRCNSSSDGENRLLDKDSFLKRGCFCDDTCAHYGDCCINSPFFNHTQQTSNPYKCGRKVSLTEEHALHNKQELLVGIYQIAKCPPSWQDEDIRDKCVRTATLYSEDFFANKPVIGLDSQENYKNIYCAYCNEENRIDMQENSTLTAQCIPNAIDACAVDWPNDRIKYNCETYTSVGYIFSQLYKNRFCAICNNDSYGAFLSPYEYLLSNDTYIPITRQMAPLSRTFKITPVELSWQDVFETPDDTSVQNVSVIENPEKARHAGKELPVFKKDNGTLDQVFRIRCNETSEISPNGCKVEPLDMNMLYATYTGLSASIVFLSLHLSAFFFGATTRTWADKSLASYSLALLMAYVFFMAGQLLEGYACVVISFLTYYSFMVAFLWLLTMSFDVWRTTFLVKTKLKPPLRRRNNTFIVFSLWNWLFPCIMCLCLYYIDMTLPEGLAESFRPKFSEDSCWFEGNSLLIYFVIPVTVIMILNILFFSSTTYMICSSKIKKTAGDLHHFLCCTRLTVMMGLNWILGSIASYLDKTWLWYAFIIFNSLQGFFLFLSFTCKRNIFTALGSKTRSTRTYSTPPKSSRSTEHSDYSHTKFSRINSSSSADRTTSVIEP